MPNVLVCIERRAAFNVRKLAGIRAYCDRLKDWHLEIVPPNLLEDTVELFGRDWDGALVTGLEGPAIQLGHSGLPTVVVTTPMREADSPHDLPSVYPDHDAAGEMAFEHFMERGLESLGSVRYRGGQHVPYVWRERVFIEMAKQAGIGVSCCQTWLAPSQPSYKEELRLTAEWLASLPKPVGIFCQNDILGSMVLRACRLAKCKAPEEVAVMGTHNDCVVCEWAQPPLSSLMVDQYTAGLEAARLLDRMIKGERNIPPRTTVPPLGVFERTSTRMLGVADLLVRRAVHLIHERVEEALDVSDIARKLGKSRATLHRRFCESLGRSVSSEIRRARISRALHQLRFTEDPLVDIAVRCGYGNTPQLSRDVKTETGLTPTAYRQQFHTGGLDV